MKRACKYFVTFVAVVALSWGYVHREPVFYHFSSFDSPKKMRFHESAYAKSYREAKEPAESRFWHRARISWDLWCVAMRAEVAHPKEKDGIVFYVVDATDRTDTRCIYVFSSEGELLEISFEPLA
jgi:hypothetical protein